MPRIETTITINRPIAEVFAFVTDFSKASQWQPGLIESKVTSSGPVGVGSTFSWVQQVVGQKMDTKGEITAWQPPVKYEWKSTAGPFPLSGGTSFKSEGNSTVIVQYADAEPGGFFKLAEGLLVKQTQSQFEAGLKKLKELLEK